MSDARPFSHIALCGTVTDCLPDAGFRSLAETAICRRSSWTVSELGRGPGE